MTTTFTTSKPTISTLGDLKKAGYQFKTVKQEIRDNLIQKLQNGEPSFQGIVGYENTVIPETETALLSRHNILYLGLRGQAKTRMARLMVNLLDDYVPVVAGSEINDHPLQPVSIYAKNKIAEMGDATPIHWLAASERYGEKLATPDVTVADLIGDIDPIKAANLKLSFANEEVIHYGIIPKSNRGIFVINELPDLQARIQVALFNILQEGDIQIRGFKLRMPLDILFVFTANPEDYTNRGSIVTPLKDRIESQILTHYPKEITHALQITRQEANIHADQAQKIQVHEIIETIIEQIAFEARSNEYVDRKSGVSARLTIAAMENAVSAAERRALVFNEKKTQVWISDVWGAIPAITGKIELVYEGEQEGPYQVSVNLLEKSIRTLFIQYFPNPEKQKKRKPTGKKSADETPETSVYRSIVQWFDEGNSIVLQAKTSDAKKMEQLYAVNGLYGCVAKYYPQVTEAELGLLMEFLLHGLASYSLISKQQDNGALVFKDLMGSMLGAGSFSDEFGDEEG